MGGKGAVATRLVRPAAKRGHGLVAPCGLAGGCYRRGLGEKEGKTGAKACGAADPGQAKARRPDAGGPEASAIEARKGRDAPGGSVHESAAGHRLRTH